MFLVRTKALVAALEAQDKTLATQWFSRLLQARLPLQADWCPVPDEEMAQAINDLVLAQFELDQHPNFIQWQEAE